MADPIGFAASIDRTIESDRSPEDAWSMSSKEQAMQLARSLAEEVVGVASELLLSDADVEHVQSCYTMPAIELSR